MNFIKIAIIVIFCCYSTAFADDWKDESGKGRPAKPQYEQGHQNKRERPNDYGNRSYKEGPGFRGQREYERRPDYKSQQGYRERPYNRGRHYGHYKYKGNQYEYRGHWRSWEQWDRYAKARPDIYKNGNYYREGAHLMFRFCEPGTGNFLFFSIGR